MALATGNNVWWTGAIFTPSRAYGTTYQNTSGYPAIVNVSGYGTGAGYLICYEDTSSPPGTRIAAAAFTASGEASVSFIVLPAYYYKCTNGATGAAIDAWVEMGLSAIASTSVIATATVSVSLGSTTPDGQLTVDLPNLDYVVGILLFLLVFWGIVRFFAMKLHE